jgi:hypothetical protein
VTHSERVLDLLADGEPHSHRELYGLYVIVHSRISDLRKRGHTIECWREGDEYLYQLISAVGPCQGLDEPRMAPPSPALADVDTLSFASPTAVQLTLVA